MRLDSGLSLRMGSWFARAVAAGSTLLDGLVSYWPLDEVSGTRADAVGDNDLTDNNTVGVSPAGPSGTVANLVAANSEFFSIESNLATATSFEVAMWVNGNTDPGEMLWETPYGNNSANSSTAYSEAANGGQITFSINDSSSGSSNAVKSGIGTGVAWRLYTFGYNATSKKAFVSVNGSAITEGSALTNGASTLGARTWFGHTYSGGYLTGKMAIVGYWSRVLDTGDRTSLFNSGNGKAYADLTTAEKVGLVSYWNLDETSNGSAPVTRVDSHSDNDLTDNGTTASATATAGAMHNAAASFVAANNEYLSYGSLLPDRRADFTISLWFKNTSSTGYQMILTAGQELEFRRDNGVYKIVGILGAATTSAIDFTGSSWTHAAMWYDDAAGKGYFQVNGASAVEMTGTPNQNISSTFLNIGRRDDGYYLDGQVDEVAIWDRVLTEDERAELYASGAGVYYNGSDFV